MKIKRIIEVIENFAPLNLALDFDNSGLIVGDANRECMRVLVTLDVTSQAIDYAKQIGANLIISHHPIIFYPIKNVLESTAQGKIISKAIKNDISLYASHTNFDNAKGGITDTLLKHFRVIERKPLLDDGTGRFAKISPMTLGDIARIVYNITGDDKMRLQGDMNKIISEIALINGAGGRDESLESVLVEKGVDLFITGEVKHSLAMILKERGIALINVEHYYSEKIFVDMMVELLNNAHIDATKYYDSNPYNS